MSPLYDIVIKRNQIGLVLDVSDKVERSYVK